MHKYGGIRFYDPDTETTFTALNDRMEFQGGKHAAGWCVVGINEKGEEEKWTIQLVVEQAMATEQDPLQQIEMIKHGEGESDANSDDDDSSSDED